MGVVGIGVYTFKGVTGGTGVFSGILIITTSESEPVPELESIPIKTIEIIATKTIKHKQIRKYIKFK